MTKSIQSGQAVTSGGEGVEGGFGVSGDLEAVNSAPTVGIASAPFTDDDGGAAQSPALDYIEAGIVEDAGWTFTPRAPVFAGADGRPTQTGAPGPSYRPIGVALSATQVLLLLPQPAYVRSAAAQRPMSIGDSQRQPHQATDAERALHKDYYGLGGPSAVLPGVAREITLQFVDNSHLALRMKGDDGVVRSVTLVLS